MMRKLVGILGILGLISGVSAFGGCTPTEREFASGGQGGAGGSGCPAGFAECDGNPETVCETETAANLEHCGECGKVCAAAVDANIACVAGECTIASCNNGRENCDAFYDNGCETNPSKDFDHCGGCGLSCESTTAITACVSGECQLAKCVGTNLDCDMVGSNGCEVDPSSNADHCGMCGAACVGDQATMACENSQCVVSACNADFGDCNAKPVDGCEVNLPSSPYHCGKCSNPCKDGGCRNGACVDPSPVGKVNFAAGPLDIFKGNLFVGSQNSDEVSVVDVVVGSVALVGKAGSQPINDILVGSNFILVAGSGATRMDWAGLNQYKFNGGLSRAIVTDGMTVYYTSSSSIRMGPLSGGNNGTFVGANSAIYGLAFDTDMLFWGLADGTIWSSATSIVLPTKLGGGPPIAGNIALDMSTIYWSSSEGIHSMPRVGGNVTNLAPASATVHALEVDATHVYWTDDMLGLVQRVSKDGNGKPEILAYNQQGPWGLALDGQYVYWSNTATGEIFKVPK